MVKRTGYLKYRTVGKSKPLRAIHNHLRYIEREREKHRNQVTFFNRDHDEADRKEFYEKIKTQKPHGVVAHKLVISLSEDERDRTGIDYRELIRETMSQYEATYKTQLDWIAAIHDDAGNPHVHMVVRGRDEQGKSVYIDTRRMKKMQDMADRIKEQTYQYNAEREIQPEPWKRDWKQECLTEQVKEAEYKYTHERGFMRDLEGEREQFPVKQIERSKSYEWER